MERYQVEDLKIIFDCAGRDDWGKFSFPVWYGIPVKLNWHGYEFDFNLRGCLKKLGGNLSVWPDPREMLKRTDGNDFIYYGTDGYESSYDLIKNYYVPFNGRADCDFFTESPLESLHVKRALEAFDGLVERVGKVAPSSPRGRARDFLLKIAAKNRAMLAGEAKKLHRIIGGHLPVLPPDTIDVDYEVIPLIITEGCSYNCRFCRFKTKGGFSIRSRENIAGQIKALREFYGEDLVNYNSLVFGQNNALAAGEDILMGAADMACGGLNLTASYHRGRPNLFIFGSADSFLQAEDSLFAGLDRLPYHTSINVGLESPDQETLDGLGKPLRVERVRGAFRKLQE
ncbi:MAG: radical SAM protein, partial [Syntrophales bacterium]|nr:radical SAM protein [Syntrophales bacterium]